MNTVRAHSTAMAMAIALFCTKAAADEVNAFAQPRPAVIDADHPPGDPLTTRAPFVDGSIGMVMLTERWESINAVAMRLGFHSGGFSFAGRLGGNVQPSFQESIPDGYSIDHGLVADPKMFVELSAGYALWASEGFVSTPALAVMRTDSGAFGTAVGIEWPFIWVTRKRLRLGFEAGLWGGFGGHTVAECSDVESGCGRGERVELSRPFGLGVTVNFVLGVELGKTS